MSHLRTEAEALAVLLEYGLLDVREAVQWADEQISAAEEPEPGLFDVSMASRENNLDTAGMLRRITGEIDWQEVALRIVERAVKKLCEDRTSANRIAEMLLFLATKQSMIRPLPRRSSSLWYKLEDAEGGFYGDATQIVGELTESLDEYLKEHARS